MNKTNLQNVAYLFERDNCELAKFEFYGKEMIEKKVKACGNTGRIYLPSDWVDCTVKIVKLDR